MSNDFSLYPPTLARDNAFPPNGDVRLARLERPDFPEGYRLAVWHGEGRTVFYVLCLEGEYWEPQKSFTSRADALAWSNNRAKACEMSHLEARPEQDEWDERPW